MAKYVILAPAKACVGLPYGVSVNVLAQPEDPVDVEIKIIDASSKKVKMETKLESLALGKAKAASLGIVPRYLARSDNVLSVKGVTKSGTIAFETSHPLKLRTDSLSIFIQTDKAIYKAGDLIQFRVIVTKEDLTPFKGFANVQIKSANGAVMEQFKGLSLNKGVARGELQLSNDPPLGYWSILVNVESEDKNLLQDERTKRFKVEKYVLPKFVVKLNHPSYSTPGKDICVTVGTKYTYGNGVPGIAHVAIVQENTKKHITKVVKLNEAGTVDVIFDYESIKGQCFTSDTLIVGAMVVEEESGLDFTAVGEMIMYKDDKKLIIVKQGDFFKPGMNFTFTVSAVTMDGKPLISDSNITIGYHVTYSVEGKEKNEKGTISLGKDGRNSIVLKTPQKATELNLKAYFKGSQSEECPAVCESVNVKASSTSKTNSFIQIGSEHCTAAKVGDVVPFIITKSGSFSLQSLTLQVISKGSIVFVAEDNSSSESVTINVPITLNMAPKSRLVAYAILSDNAEVLVDAAVIHVNGLIRNDVSVSIDPVKVKPCSNDGVKNEATVTVKADHESFIGILGVDQSVLLPKSGNDITHSVVEKAIESYDIVPNTVKFHDGFIYGVGEKYAKEVITNSGLLIFTDASVDENPVPRGTTDPCSRKAMTPTAKPVRVKVHPAVPGTWIWFNSITREDGKIEYKAQVPHTASSFIVSAFAVHPRTGLGIAPTPAQVEVFSPIFVSLNLPYCIKKGEKFAFQPLIFNNGDSGQTVTVTLEHNNESGFDIIKNSGENVRKDEIYNQRIVQVKAARSETATFTIVPTVIGHLKLLVKAVGQTATDGAEASLLVKPEGVCVYFNRPLILDFTRGNRGTFESTINMMPPTEIQKKLVDDSESIEFSVIGDVMGPILSGLDNLIRMPCGCGEQNVITMMQNAILLRYLIATGEDRKHPQLIPKARMNIEIGYQRQLSYMHKDGSFSMFGEKDKNGSTLLTSYVIRSFFDAKDYIFIDPEILSRAISWLSERQKSTGEYEENGIFITAGMQCNMDATLVQLESNRMRKTAARLKRVWRNIKSVFRKDGSGDHGVLITAFVLIALIRAGHQNEKAIEYLEDNVERNRYHPYIAAVTAYALGLAKSAKFRRALDILTESAVNQAGERHWFPESAKDSTGADLWQGEPEPFDVETTSYALLSYLLVNRFNDAIPCMRWLSAHRNSLGGFVSTQDTVAGIWALSKYARMVGKRTDISIDVIQGNKKKNFKLNDQNRIVLQREKLDTLLQPVEIVASGNGTALAQVSWHYNVQNLSDSKPFECDAIVKFDSSAKFFFLTLMFRYNLKGKSNMILMEVEVPSGYQVDSERVNDLFCHNSKQFSVTPSLRRVECTMSDTLVSLYFDELEEYYSYVELLMLKLFDVQDPKPSQIRLIDYYQPHKTLHMDYSIANAYVPDMTDDEWDAMLENQ